MKLSRLIKTNNGADTFDALGHFSDAADFLAAGGGLSAAAGAQAPGPGQNFIKPDESNVIWKKVQYYLLNQTYLYSATASL